MIKEMAQTERIIPITRAVKIAEIANGEEIVIEVETEIAIVAESVIER
jgi:hypothetical protein